MNQINAHKLSKKMIEKFWNIFLNSKADRFLVGTDGKIWAQYGRKAANVKRIKNVDSTPFLMAIDIAGLHNPIMVNNLVPNHLKKRWRLGLQVESNQTHIWGVFTPYRQKLPSIDDIYARASNQLAPK
jgi:hypothetical protein